MDYSKHSAVPVPSGKASGAWHPTATGVTSSQITGLAIPFTPTNESYGFDANGNRKDINGGSQSSTNSHNRLQTDGTYNYVYDNEGNVTIRTKISDNTVTEYAWDYRNRLNTVTDKTAAGGSTTKRIEYTYDVFDNRTAKRVDVDGNGSWDRYEVFSWADGQEVMRWVDSDGQAATEMLRLADRYLWSDAVDKLLSDEQYLNNTGMLISATSATAVAGNTLWALNDHQGSVRDLIDNNGIVRQHVVYDSFGNRLREVDYDTAGTAIASNNAAAIDTVFGYTGRDWDADIGMQYNRSRWYDPKTGRWLSQDPIGFAAGDANLYRYVGNRATNREDPSGKQDPKMPSDFPIDITDASRNDATDLLADLYLQGVSQKSRYEIFKYGCGALASYRFGNIVTNSEYRGFKLMFPSLPNNEGFTRDGKNWESRVSSENYWFPSYQSASEAADRLIKQGKQVRIMLYQSSMKPASRDEDYIGTFDLQYDPSKLPGSTNHSPGIYNFSTMHWDDTKCSFYFEYVNDSGGARITKSPGKMPEFMHGIRMYNYWAVVVITPEMKKNSIGLPKVPWKE